MSSFDEGLLWEPQREALAQLRQYFAAYPQQQHPSLHRQPQTVQMPTGCGKTSVIALLPEIQRQSRATLVLVSSCALVEQIVNSIRATYQRLSLPTPSLSTGLAPFLSTTLTLLPTFFVINVHKFGAWKADDARWQSFCARISLVAVDEAHHAPAFLWHRLLSKLSRCPQILFTATPYRSDEKRMPGELLYQYTLRRAIQARLVKHPILHLLISPANSDQLLLERTAQQLRLSPNGQQAIGFAATIEHAYQLAEMARSIEGLQVEVWHSEMSDEEQAQARRRFEVERSVNLLLQVKMCAEAYDHPPVSVVTLFKTVCSPSVLEQAMGRALRRCQEGNEQQLACIIVDSSRLSRALWESIKRELVQPTFQSQGDDEYTLQIQGGRGEEEEGAGIIRESEKHKQQQKRREGRREGRRRGRRSRGS